MAVDLVSSPASAHPVGRSSAIGIVMAAFVGSAIVTILAVLGAYAQEDPHPAEIVYPAAEGPSASVFVADWPDEPLGDGIGHDGQQFYAIARQPMHLAEVAPDLDRPHYRLQRIAFPALVWALHPSGGGDGLVVATVVVGGLALLAGGIAAGWLSVQLGGPPWVALVFCLLPGAFTTLRISTADTLALAAALAAVALSLGGRHRWAVGAGVLAVLAKESTWLLLLGVALWRRDRARALLAGVPAAVGGAWWIWLRLVVDDTSEGVTEFVPPFVGIADSLDAWLAGDHVVAAVAVVLSLVLGALALARVGLRHPLGWAILLQLAFLPWLNRDVLGLTFNGTRMTMPLLVLSLIALLGDERRRAAEQASATAPAAAAAG